ncbi:MAG: 4-hydroxyphenylacetate 3-monooxygenase oxygenase component [Candidatus Tectimicrobiota bacterium]|nr:MAG: 4-hydroxyphenylacetate 3-monooxygenase oxygenase component [Candidatus Tectomicrobia bacterium]
MARTGAEYLQGLKDDREVWLGGERVKDVTEHPALAAAARKMAEYYDLHHAAAEVCLMPDPQSGTPMSVSHLIPRSRQDLQRRHACLERIAVWGLGMLGRTPDYLNVTLAGFAGRADIWAQNGNEQGAANLVAYHRELVRRDLALTHTIVHPTVDRRLPDVFAGGGEVALHKVADTEHGILVRGARLLATLAPFADELLVYPGQPIPAEAHRYALAFAIPMNTPGLKVLCRDSYTVPSSAFDHPFSSCFDEQDAFVIFDDVEVPRHRVFLDGDPQIYNRVMNAGWVANIMQQTTIRAQVKLEFAYELACAMAEALGDDSPRTREQLGEIWTYAELTRAALCAAEAGAREWGNGVWFCDERPFLALRPTLPRWFVRVNDLLKGLGAHNFLTTPRAADFANPALRPLLERYLQGATVDAKTRTRLFRLAWDFVGTALASRMELYERFYLASSPRTYQLAHLAAKRQGTRGLLAQLLKEAP